MKPTNRTITLGIVAAIAAAAGAAQAAPFTAGDLAVFEASSSPSNTTGNIVELNTTTANQTAVQTIAIPGGAANANGLQFSGSASSTGYLSHTADGTLLTFTGVNTTSTGNVNTLNPRGVGTLDVNGTYTLQTTYTGTVADSPQTRSATSFDNSTWYISDQDGIYSNGTTAPSPVANTRAIKPFGGTAYVLQQSAVTTNIVVSTVSAPTGGTLTGLTGLANDNSAQDFYMISSGSNGSEYDVLYVLDESSKSVGTIDKYSLVGGTWTANGTYTTNFGGFGLAAAVDDSGVDLYATTGSGSTAANSVIKLFDAAGYDTAIDITTANNVTLFTTPSGTTLKGIDFAPIAPSEVPEPASLALLGFGAALMLRRRH